MTMPVAAAVTHLPGHCGQKLHGFKVWARSHAHLVHPSWRRYSTSPIAAHRQITWVAGASAVTTAIGGISRRNHNTPHVQGATVISASARSRMRPPSG